MIKTGKITKPIQIPTNTKIESEHKIQCNCGCMSKQEEKTRNDKIDKILDRGLLLCRKAPSKSEEIVERTAKKLYHLMSWEQHNDIKIAVVEYINENWKKHR